MSIKPESSPFPAGSRQYQSLADRMADPAVQAGRAQALAKMALRSRAPDINAQEAKREIQRLQIDADMVERACRAHWPSFDRMRPDHAAEKRVKMQAELAAALYGGRPRP